MASAEGLAQAARSGERPEAVAYACWFAVVAIALGLVDSVRLFLLPSRPLPPIVLLSTTLATVTVWGLIVYAFTRGHRWARLVFLVFTALGAPGVALTLAFQSGDRLLQAVALTQQASNLTAAILLLLPASSRWYRERKHSPRPTASAGGDGSQAAPRRGRSEPSTTL